MALPSGTRLGPYEIVSPLGAGGMGEVYKGRDTRLDRIVAIKVLPEQLASDARKPSRKGSLMRARQQPRARVGGAERVGGGGGTRLSLGVPKALSDLQALPSDGFTHAIAADGQRILAARATAAPTSITVVVNWPALLNRPGGP